MPLPWKKTKPNRISRIVADLQPPSRAASLVVETGFPTSVVDLFVKNRDRIKRHSLRKPKNKQQSTHVSESIAPPPTPSLSPDNSPRLPEHEDVVLTATCSTAGRKVDGLQHQPFPADVQSNVVSARPNVYSNANADADADADGVYLNSVSMVFVVVMKMFLVVIPVLSTQKLVLGITISAFLLFLFEIFGKFAVCNLLNRSLIRNRFVPTTAKSSGVGLNYRGGGGGEEDAVATNSGMNNAIHSEDDEGMCLEREAVGNGEKGFVGCGDLEVGKNEISRRAKLRAKIIKKLIPKKLRGGKRVKKSKKEKQIMKQEMGITINENEQETESSCGEEDEEVWEEEEEEEEEEDVGASMTRKGKNKEDEEEEEGKKSFECKIVIITILLGLCGGRFLAFVLTVSGCFMFKFIKNLTHKWRFG
ncbi:hypothetical protein Csa_003115 [Cucumis sativus]|nr:hypothetical protein Csa_003115 [Cucumis sativus]